MELMNIKTALSFVNTFYGVNIKESDFEEIALNAWELIGNKHTELKEYKGSTDGKTLDLPCDCVEIESVTIPVIDANITSPLFDGLDYESVAIEKYIEHKPSFDSPYYERGKLVKYKLAGDKLQFDRDYKHVLIVYHGIITDESGLPLINDKEMRAIALYVAYSNLYKEGLMKKDGNILNVANTMKQDWWKACNAARVTSNMTQNDMDAVLDAKYSYDRKQYGKSFKPVR